MREQSSSIGIAIFTLKKKSRCLYSIPWSHIVRNIICRRDYCHFYSFPLRLSDIIFITFFLLYITSEYYTPETKKSRKTKTMEEVMRKETEMIISQRVGWNVFIVYFNEAKIKFCFWQPLYIILKLCTCLYGTHFLFI